MPASAIQLQRRRGTQAQVLAATGAAGELIVDTTNNRVCVQDGVTAGGWPAPKITETGELAITLTGINFNAANTDNQLVIPYPPTYTRFVVIAAFISGASQTLTTATCGLFTATGGGGAGVVATGTAITVNTAAANTNNNCQSLTIVDGGTLAYSLATVPALYFRVQTAEGAAATATVTVFIRPLP